VIVDKKDIEKGKTATNEDISFPTMLVVEEE